MIAYGHEAPDAEAWTDEDGVVHLPVLAVDDDAAYLAAVLADDRAPEPEPREQVRGRRAASHRQRTDTPPDVAGATTPASPRRLRTRRASQVTPVKATWLWRTGEFGRIPLGEVSLAAGRGNVGKSPFALWLCARLTNGDLPGDLYGTPVDVAVYASEDSHEHTTIPRLIAAGADLDRVHLIEGTEIPGDDEDTVIWKRDLPLIEEHLAANDARLLVIDPLVDVHKAGSNTNLSDDVRAGIRPLVAMAHRAQVTVLGIGHFNKQRTTDVASLLSGAHGLRDIVRAVLAFVEGGNGERVLGQDKNNLGRSGDDVPRLTYDMKSIEVAIGDDLVSQPVFAITGTTDATLADVLGREGNPTDGPIPDDVQWLFDALVRARPYPQLASTLASECDRRGFKWDTVSRKARKTKLMHAERENQGDPKSPWVWRLTEQGALRASEATTDGGADW